MKYTNQNIFVNGLKSEEKLSSGFGSVTDSAGKQTTAYIVEKRYKVHDYFWSVFWGNGDYKMKESQSLGQRLIYEFRLTVDDWRVLFSILDMMNIGNLFEYKQKVIAEALNISESRVSKSIKKLTNYGVLYSLKEFGKVGFYINASVCYRGEMKIGAKLMSLDLKEQVEMALQMSKGIYTGQKKRKNAHQGE